MTNFIVVLLMNMFVKINNIRFTNIDIIFNSFYYGQGVTPTNTFVLFSSRRLLDRITLIFFLNLMSLNKRLIVGRTDNTFYKK